MRRGLFAVCTTVFSTNQRDDDDIGRIGGADRNKATFAKAEGHVGRHDSFRSLAALCPPFPHPAACSSSSMGADHTPLLTADGFDLLSLVRPNILALQPYRCARDDYDSGILLDANENAYGTAHDASVTDGFITELERYPDPMNRDLKVRKATGVRSAAGGSC